MDPRERELQQEIAAATKELRQLKNRQKNVANSGITNADIKAAEKTVKDAKGALEAFRKERTQTLGAVGIEQAQQELTDALNEQADLKARSQLGEEAPLPGVIKGGVPGRLVSQEDLDRAADKVKQKQKKLSTLTGTEPAVEEEQPETGYTQPLTASEIRREISGAGIPVTVRPFIGIKEDDYVNIGPTNTPGLFEIGVEGFGPDYIFLAEQGSSSSRPIRLEDFKTNIYNFTPEQIVEFKRAIGYKDETPAVSTDFANKLTSIALEVSELNYRNGLNGNAQISLPDFIINPEKFGGLIGSGTQAATGASAEQIRVRRQSIDILATELGVGLTDGAANKLASEWANGLYDSNSIRQVIARSGTIDFAKGLAAETLNNLREYASSFGMQYDDGWFNKAATNVLTGKDAEETYTNQIREIAKTRYPTLAEQIDSGFTVRQLASPYIQTMSSVLEIDPNTIGLNDNYVSQALTGLTADGKPATKPLWQFEQELRKDPRWNFTNNAQQSLMNTARRVLQDFGLVS